jgi:hypothetical protein
MAEKPMLFNTQMVQAILDGRKTMTRRVVADKFDPANWDWDIQDKGFGPFIEDKYGDPIEVKTLCPYGVPGDRLYVRETWRIGAWAENPGRISVDYKADGYIRREWLDVEDPERFERYWIQSTHDAEKAGLKFDLDGQYHWEPGKAPTRWRPSIFMPKEAARIWLTVTDVRVERLQEITTDEAKAEGALQPGVIPSNTLVHNTEGTIPRTNFKILWDSLNASRGFSWEQNPWVWVVSFKREQP